MNGDGYSDFVIGTSSNAAYIIYNSAASYSPSASPTVRPTAPTVSPSTQIPTAVPSFAPSYLTFPPTITPSVKPSIVSVAPTMVARALKSLDLAGINTGQGVKISGAITQDQAGYSVKGAGDFNKDGYADVIIGAPYSSINGKTNSGTSYLLFGSSSGLSNIDLLSLSSNQGFKITGENLGDNSGWSVASAGDVNGDGYSDIVIGAPNADPNLRGNSGTSYVIFGKATGFADIDLLSLTVAQGFRVLGAASGDNSGSTVASAGDINGDGYSDIVIGAIYASPNSRSQAGTSYVIFGKATSFADIDLLSLTSAQGFKILGAASGDNSGNSVASAGDINGDGYNDIVIGALKIGGYYGISTYVIFGKASGFIDIDLSSLSNTQGFRVFGAGNGYNLIGYSVSGAGDVNGDGYSDIVIGTYQASLTSTNSAGTSYVMFGKASGFTDINLSSLNSTRGFRVIGVAASDASGSSVASAGDVNGDGYSDIVIGAYLADPKSRTDAGTAYVIFGKASGFTDINLASLTSTQGFNILGAASGDNSGNSVASAGDVNGDGYSDIVIGASGASPNSRSYAGAAYIIYNSAASYSPSASPTRTPTRTPTFFPTGQPSSQPSRQPTTQPSTQPSKQPIVYPTSCPTGQPSSKPSVPTSLPSTLPSTQPSSQPTVQPSSQPSAQPSSLPSMQPTSHPSAQPSSQPSVQPSDQPTALPSVQPTMQPSGQPSVQPTVQPSGQPSALPSSQPSMQPSSQPSTQPSAQPTIQPSGHPSAHPSVQPSEQPSTQPSMQPSSQPTAQPSSLPSMQPNSQPSAQPSSQPSVQPSVQPSAQPSSLPSMQPTSHPSAQPSVQPTMQPSGQPSALPSSQPSMQPSSQPSTQPSAQPTIQPSGHPSAHPSVQPSEQPSTQPSMQPSSQPTAQPSSLPSMQPNSQPSAQPSSQPTAQPSVQPTMQPSGHPSALPSSQPSMQPSSQPTAQPSVQPTMQPSGHPSALPSSQPSMQPSSQPSAQPSAHPTIQPSMQPSDQPTAQPSVQPTVQPSGQPSVQPSAQPTGQPSAQPISKPTAQPSGQPSVRPSSQPTVQPSTHPSMQPSSKPSYHPSSRPTSTPSIKLLPGKTHKPSKVPSYRPTFQPTFNPTNSPTKITFTVTGNINNFKIKNSLLGYYKNSKSSLSDVVIPKASLGINYLIYGSKKTPRDIDLSKENNGLFSPIKESPLSLDQTTRSLSLIGDFNGDGFDDLLLGDPFNSKTYVFYGNQAGFTNMDLGFINFGEKATDFYGWSVASAKDFNGDGYPDLVTSALTAKKVYITFGKGSISRNVNLLSMTSDQGIIVSNSVQGYLCIDVEGIGDINLDGYNDIAITATQSSASSVYVIFGNKHPQNINLSLLTQKQGFVIAAQIQTILSLAFLGDVNQDGVSDFAIGGLSLNSNSEQNSYIVYGQKNISSFSLEKLDVNQGFKILGAGFFVNGPVDLNKDGINDILIVNLLNWRSNSATYIITYPHNITSAPTLLPSSRPSSIPSLEPTGTPSCNPSSNPTVEDSTSGQEVSLSPTTRHSGPTVLPSYAPSRTCRPSKVPTFLPSKTNRPSSNTPTIMRSVAPITHAPSYKPSCKPSKDPTISPSSDIQAGYITAYVSKANVYKAPNSKSLLIINSTNDVMIIAGNAPYVYKIIPTPRVVIIINNFKLNQDKIDLFQFKNIQSIKDLNYQVPPLNIKLDNQQKLIIYSQKSFELKENNFIFAPAGDQNKNSDSKENLISSLTSGLTLIGLAGFVAVANGLKNLFGIKIEEISSHEDSDLNELEKGKIDDNSDDLGKEVAQHSNFQNEEKYDNSDLDSLLSEDSFFLSMTDQKSSSLVFTRSNSENSIVEYIQETYPEAVSDDHAWLNANSDEDTIINFMEGASPENYEDLLELIGQQEENA